MSDILTDAELDRLKIGQLFRRSKFKNKKTLTIHGEFDSQGEALRYEELITQQAGGMIRQLLRQQTFDLVINNNKICAYTADYTYWQEQPDKTWKFVVEDFKGVRTDVYKLKRKLMYALKGIVILETGRKKKKRRGRTLSPRLARRVKA